MSGWRYPLLDAMARRGPPSSTERTSIVVYSPGHLGDVLHAVPMLKALRTGKPKAKIVWLVGPWSEALARRYAADVDEIRVFGPNLPNYTRGNRKWCQSALLQWRMAMALRREGMECLISPADGVGRFLANAICPKRWVGIGDWRPPRVRAEVQTHFQPYEKDRYEADALCGLLQPLGIEAHADRLEYAVTPEERKSADEFLRAEGMDLVRSLALIAPGSGWSGKNWLPDRFGEVAEWLAGLTLGDRELPEAGSCSSAAQGDWDLPASGKPGSAGTPRPTESLCDRTWVGRTLRVSRSNCFQVAWVGGEGEQSLVPKSRAADFNWAGKTPLPLLAAVMERAHLFIGNDGGLLHIAAALDVPTVSVWGPTSPGKWGPKGPIHRQIRKVEHCDGCIYWDYREACRHDHACMKAVPIEEVQMAISEVLRSGTP